MSTRRAVRSALHIRLTRAVSWCLVAAVVTLLAVSVVVPRIAGATPFTIVTGSMKPSMPPGTLVVVRPVDADRISTGSVITYQVSPGDPTVVTHRVISQGVQADGTPIFRTQGDANPVPDPDWVRPVQVRGERWYSIAYIGYVTTFVTSGQRQVVQWICVAGLLGYASAMFVAAARDRRDVRRHRAGAAA